MYETRTAGKKLYMTGLMADQVASRYDGTEPDVTLVCSLGVFYMTVP